MFVDQEYASSYQAFHSGDRKYNSNVTKLKVGHVLGVPGVLSQYISMLNRYNFNRETRLLLAAGEKIKNEDLGVGGGWGMKTWILH